MLSGAPRFPLPHHSLSKLIEQRLCVLQIARIEAFGEPAVDRSEKLAGSSRLP
jgi:hypothetical protein